MEKFVYIIWRKLGFSLSNTVENNYNNSVILILNSK